MDLTRLDPRSLKVSFRLPSIRDSQQFLFVSDIHIDNAQTDRQLFFRHMEQAKAKGAPVCIFGDYFCAMQGKWDKRKSEKALLPQHRGEDYLDLLVEESAELLRPYAQNILVISEGNHEFEVTNRHGVDLIQRLAQELKRDGSPVVVMPYEGWLCISAELNGKTRPKAEHCAVYYSHGYGGGGEATRGLLDQSRTRAMACADIYISGHIHRQNLDVNVIEELSPKGHPRYRRQLFLRSSTYKREVGGWHARKGRGPRPLGGWWINYSSQRPNGRDSNRQLTWTAELTDGF